MKNELSNFFNMLSKPGDTLFAKVKLKTGDVKRSATFYPTTGRIVETISYLKDV